MKPSCVTNWFVSLLLILAILIAPFGSVVNAQCSLLPSTLPSIPNENIDTKRHCCCSKLGGNKPCLCCEKSEHFNSECQCRKNIPRPSLPPKDQHTGVRSVQLALAVSSTLICFDDGTHRLEVLAQIFPPLYQTPRFVLFCTWIC